MTRPVPCQICGMTGAHWSGCQAIKATSQVIQEVKPVMPKKHLDTGRARAALHANAQGGVVDVIAFEAAEYQAHLDAVTLPYDPVTRTVLRGTCRGLSVDSAVGLEMTHLLARQWGRVRVREVAVRPWWRWWRLTPAYQLIPLVHQEAEPVQV